MSSGKSPISSIGVVLDVGLLDTKVGFAGEAFPRCIVPTIIGRFRRLDLLDGFPDIYFGKEAVRNRGLSNLTWAIRDGVIDNWDEIEKFWHHLFYKELYVAPELAQAKLCYVTKDYDEEIASTTNGGDSCVSFELPDGQHMLIGKERFMCPEIVFRPSLLDIAQPSIVDDICNSINKCDVDYKKLFFNIIVISGGSSMFHGLPERLRVELSKRVVDLPGIRANVDALTSRSVAAWAGGSIMASLSTMNNFCMTFKEYEDAGPNCVNYKFY